MAEVYLSSDRVKLEQFLNIVSEAILQGNMSLFLGAGSSMQYQAPSWNELIDNIDGSYNAGSNIDKAQYAELKGVDIKTEISKKTALIKFDKQNKNTYLNYLLNFDYKSLWTTNYDLIIEKVLEQKAKAYKVIYKYSHFQDLSYPGGCFLFKINGSCDDPKTIIVTKEDFINYRKSHEAYLILLKRELLCQNFLFLGCSFEDDILRICIKDILNCIENSEENYVSEHYAIIVEEKAEKLEYISKDLSIHYSIKCLTVQNVNQAYKIAYGISCKVKYGSVFVSGAKKYERHSDEENYGKIVCQNIVNAFMQFKDFPFKFISGMGMSIGHFICGTIKQNCKEKNLNLNRYLQMEPFPFTSKNDNDKHRENIINKAGIFLFVFGDLDEASDGIQNSGIWREYILAKKNKENILIPLPCGIDSISYRIFEEEKKEEDSFSAKYCDLLQNFDYKATNTDFYDALVDKIILTVREKMDNILDDIESSLKIVEAL